MHWLRLLYIVVMRHFTPRKGTYRKLVGGGGGT
jgi:hypothetical protein